LGDKKLAHSAQMFHYQHQKQQIIAMENRNAEMNHNEDENDSDDNENDFTVYGEWIKLLKFFSSLTLLLSAEGCEKLINVLNVVNL
jgi:hypothetical protein